MDAYLQNLVKDITNSISRQQAMDIDSDRFVNELSSFRIKAHKNKYGEINTTPEEEAEIEELAQSDVEYAWFAYNSNLRNCLFFDLVYEVLKNYPSKKLLGQSEKVMVTNYMRASAMAKVQHHFDKINDAGCMVGYTTLEDNITSFTANDRELQDLLDINKHNDDTPLILFSMVRGFLKHLFAIEELPWKHLTYEIGNKKIPLLSGWEISIYNDGFLPDRIIEYYCQLVESRFIPDETLVADTKKASYYYYASRCKRRNKKINRELIPLYAQMPFIYLSKWIGHNIRKSNPGQPVYPVLNCLSLDELVEKECKNIEIPEDDKGDYEYTDYDHNDFVKSFQQIFESVVGNNNAVFPSTKLSKSFNPENNILDNAVINPIEAYPKTSTEKRNYSIESSNRSIFPLLSYIHSCIISYKAIYENLIGCLLDAEAKSNGDHNFLDKIFTTGDTSKIPILWYEFLLQLFRIEFLLRNSIFMKAIYHNLISNAFASSSDPELPTKNPNILNYHSLFSATQLLYRHDINFNSKDSDYIDAFNNSQQFINDNAKKLGEAITADNFSEITFKIFTTLNKDWSLDELDFKLLDSIDEKIVSIMEKPFNDMEWTKLRTLINGYFKSHP